MKRGMSGIITSVIIIGIALAAIGIVWFVINTVVSEQTSQVENTSSKVFQSCKDAGYYKMNTGDVCQGVVSYLGGEKCCQSGLVVNYGLISYWSFDVNASDDWGNNSGTVYGATWNSTGGFNGKGAYEFDGANDYIDVDNFGGLDIDGFGVTAWYKFKGSPGYVYDGLLGSDLGGYTGGFRIYINNNSAAPKAQVNATSGNDLNTPGAYNLSEWYHVGVSFSYPGTLKIYINGNEKNSISSFNPGELDVDWVRIGLAQWYFNGTIDEVRIYNRVLSADEIKALYELN